MAFLHHHLRKGILPRLALPNHLTLSPLYPFVPIQKSHHRKRPSSTQTDVIDPRNAVTTFVSCSKTRMAGTRPVTTPYGRHSLRYKTQTDLRAGSRHQVCRYSTMLINLVLKSLTLRWKGLKRYWTSEDICACSFCTVAIPLWWGLYKDTTKSLF